MNKWLYPYTYHKRTIWKSYFHPVIVDQLKHLCILTNLEHPGRGRHQQNLIHLVVDWVDRRILLTHIYTLNDSTCTLNLVYMLHRTTITHSVVSRYQVHVRMFCAINICAIYRVYLVSIKFCRSIDVGVQMIPMILENMIIKLFLPLSFPICIEFWIILMYL